MKPLSVVFLWKCFLICSESTYYLLLRSSITKNTHPFHGLLDLLFMSVDLIPNVGQEAKYTHMLDSMTRSGKSNIIPAFAAARVSKATAVQ